MKAKKILLVLMMVLLLLLMTSCAPGDGANSVEHPAGFFSGVWHKALCAALHNAAYVE